MARIGDRGEMEAFVRAVELASFSSAARELGLTPSTLSKLVARLERSLKARLVTRSARRIMPTPEGELFLARCRRILVEMEDAEVEIGGSRERPRGRLRMHTGPGFGMGPFAQAVPRFLERHPEVQLELMLDDRSVDVVRENIDLSITVWTPQNRDLVVREIFKFGRVTCAAPEYLSRHGMPRVPDDLLKHRVLRVASTLALPWRFVTAAGIRTLDKPPDLVVNNAHLCLGFALSGLGVIQMMEFQVAEALRTGRLVHVLPEYPCPDGHTMLAIYRHETYRLPRVRAMVDFVQETFGRASVVAGAAT
jgi:DNA-binding transcriptional LysR family regulator